MHHLNYCRAGCEKCLDYREQHNEYKKVIEKKPVTRITNTLSVHKNEGIEEPRCTVYGAKESTMRITSLGNWIKAISNCGFDAYP